MGVLPAVSLARAVPRRIQIRLNIDFAQRGKAGPARSAARQERLGRNCPAAAEIAGRPGKYFHFS
jgi:hypothetical protein